MINSVTTSLSPYINLPHTKDQPDTSDAGNQQKQPVDPSTETPAEHAQLSKLQTRDAQVRAHEAAHLAAGGGVVSGGAKFTYQQGPDGRMYAIGGEVPISTSGATTPEETIAVAQRIRAAALAPADPSPQDYKVAATASMMEARAQQELNAHAQQEGYGSYNQDRSPDEKSTFSTYS